MKILLGGDSTMANYPNSECPMTGWGQMLSQELGNKWEVRNFAKPGSTSRLFIEEGLFDQLLQESSEGDVAIFQFGHNDQKEISGVSLNSYYKNLKSMIVSLKEKQVKPIICTPVERRVDTNGHLGQTLKEYPHILKRISKEEEIPFFDLNRYTYYYYQQLGLEKSKELFLWLGPNEHQNYPTGWQDNTHFSEKGAKVVARYVALRLREYLPQEAMFSKYYYGSCMYPEVWSPEIFESDVKKMKEIGMNFARIGEFMWKNIEPQEGVFDFSTLKRALDLYRDNDIDVCLCIPTPTPPRWFTKKYPDSLIANHDGTKMIHGSRQHVCTNNEDFRRYAYRMTQEITAFASQYENVVLIQLDNEFKCHVDMCYCDTCQSKWGKYLEEEYRTIDWLNQSWGTFVWSEAYDTFSDVVMPLTTPFLHNTSLMNAFRRFTADTLNEFAHDLCHFIRMETKTPITHNTAFGFNLQNDDLFADLDVAGFDTYAPANNYPAFTLNLDRWRNVKPSNQELFLLETCTANAGHIENYMEPRPDGFVASEIFIGFAGNLRAFNYWHFRGHRYGVEQPHSTVLTSWGESDRGYADVLKGGEIRQTLEPLLKNSKFIKSKVAMMYSDYAKRFYTIDNGGFYDHRTLVTEFYGSLIRQGISVEVIQENEPLEEYEVLFVPFVRWISPTLLGKFQAFIKKGGKLILGPMTGDRTEELAWPEKNGLDILGENLGLHHIQQTFVEGCDWKLESENYSERLGGLVTTFSCPDDWEVLGTANQQTVMARKENCFYLGALPNDLTDSKLWREFCEKEVVPYELDLEYIRTTNGVMKYRRETDESVQIYLANLGSWVADYTLFKDGKEILEKKEIKEGTHELSPYSYQVIEWRK